MTALASLLLATFPAQAACDGVALAAALQAAEQRFVDEDPKGLAGAVATARKVMSCVREPLPPPTCARVHRVRALEAWANASPDLARASLRAMLHADPHMELPPELVPADHPLRGLLLRAEEEPFRWVEAPGSGWLLVDGLKSGAVPQGQPYVLQPLKPDGSALGAKISG